MLSEEKKFEKVDILIPVHNAFDFVQRCVHSILNANTKFLNKIILVNDCSTEKGLSNMFTDPRVFQTSTPKRSYFSGTVNYGFQYVKSPFFVLLNSDTRVLTEDWLQLLQEYHHDGIGILSPCWTEYKNPHPIPRTQYDMKHLGAVSWFMRSDLFKHLGMLKTEGKYQHWNSDFDFCDKVINKGLLIGKVPCFVAHWGGQSGKPKEVPRY